MINWNRVNEPCEEIGPEDFGEVVDLFLEEVEQVIGKLQASPNLANLGGDLHFLKDSALNLGFQTLAVLCQAGETRAAESDADNIDVPEIIGSFYSSKSEFQAMLGTQAASLASKEKE